MLSTPPLRLWSGEQTAAKPEMERERRDSDINTLRGGGFLLPSLQKPTDYKKTRLKSFIIKVQRKVLSHLLSISMIQRSFNPFKL